MRMKRVLVALALTLSAGLHVAHADTYPSRTIRIVVPLPPGICPPSSASRW